MPTPLRRTLRLARRGTWYAAALVLVAMALVAGITSQLLPLVERHPDAVAAWLGVRAGRTVAFDTLDTTWTRRGPLLRVQGLRVGDGANAVPIGEAEILVSQYAGLLPGRSFTEVRLRNLALTAERAADGRWSVRGLPGQGQAGTDPLAALEGLGELQVIGARLTIDAPAIDLQADVPRIDLRLRVQGNRVRVGARAWMQPGRAPLALALDFHRDSGDGQVYAGATRADLAAWAPLLRMGGIAVTSGTGRAAAWGDLRGHRVTALTVDAALDAVGLRGAPLSDASPAATTVRFARIEALAQWRLADGGWRVHAPRLRVSGDAMSTGAVTGSRRDAVPSLQSLDGLQVAGGRHYGLRAQRIDATPLLALATLSDRVPAGLRTWLGRTAPRAILHDVAIAGVRGGALRASARLEAFGFDAVGKAPGMSGLAGGVQGDGNGLTLAFDKTAPVRIDWPHGFRDAHVVTLQGVVSGWREEAGWRVGTPALRITGAGYGADLRAGLLFEGDGTRPRLDLAIGLDDAEVVTAKRFWTERALPAAAVRWLDAALLTGHVRHGRAIVVGDLDDWPFRRHEGVFEARARVDGVVLKYQPGWPAGERLAGEVHFADNGFSVEGSATVAGVDIPEFEGGITDFAEGRLRVNARLASDAARMLALLRQSPLQGRHGATLAQVAVAGPATGVFAMVLPLRGPAPLPSIAGEVALRGARLSAEEWKLDFSDVRGLVRYDQHGFSATDLAVTQEEARPGRLSLRAGQGHVQGVGSAFEGELAATLSVEALLERAPQLAWLRPRLRGRSPWTIAVTVPQATAAGRPARPTRLLMRSSLVGTTLELPAPLDKAAATPLPTRIEAVLPLADGDLLVALGQRLALRARSSGSRTGVRVVLGSDQVSEAPPVSGLVASGRTDRLDALPWMTVATGGGSGGSGLALRSIDVVAARLLLLGGSFPGTRVQVTPAPAGTAIRVDGVALAGAVLVPDAKGAAVAGRLQRLHWRSATAGGGAMAAASVPAPVAIANAAGQPAAGTGSSHAFAADDIDPAAVPPLSLVVDDLRVGNSSIGATTLRTRPIPGGLRIEQLQARSPRQRVDVDGEWTGRGPLARTRIKAVVASEDFGSLLAGFGLGARLDQGHGSATFAASWPGSPAAFRLGELQGTLALQAEDGRLVEIEPGAGRVLGLLSVAMIPRRLTLDFRDFFSRGFAFNRMAGTLRFGGGLARSDDLVIEGPAADISIRGAANLRAQTFDQTIEVVPKTGNLLTAVGALAGGPVGAAVGAVANAMLNKPIGQMSARTYRVTGPWKDPKVEVINRAQGRVATQPRRPAG